MYSKIIHYGCSFTYGVDSGGDEIDDLTLSYPAHLSRKTNIPHVNRANPGASLEQMALIVHEDLQNPDSDIHEPNALVIVNLTSHLRIMSTVARWRESYINKKYFGVCNVNPSTPIGIKPQMDNILKSFAEEEEWLFYHRAYNIINSINNQLTLANKKFVFVDMLLNINDMEQSFKLHPSIKQNMLTNEVGSFFKSIRFPASFYSKSKHYYSEGYEAMAEIILLGLQEMKIL